MTRTELLSAADEGPRERAGFDSGHDQSFLCTLLPLTGRFDTAFGF